MSGAGMDWLGLSGKVVVITGGSGGIGRACMRGFHAAGARVVALDYDPADAEAAARETDRSTERAMGIGCDVSNPASVAKAGQVVADWGGADVLINNAGILRPGHLDMLALGDWQRMLEVNLNGCLLAAQSFGQQMMAKGGGAIVHVASIAATQPQPFSGAYSSGKAAVSMLSRQLAFEWGPKGIRSNCVSPGLVVTPMSQAFYADEAVKQAREACVPLGRIGRPEDIANAAIYLASAGANYVNGQEIVVDGGLSQTLMSHVPRPGFG